MGVEIDEAPLAKARANRELPNLTYVHGDATGVIARRGCICAAV
jgi:hypothetical protein